MIIKDKNMNIIYQNLGKHLFVLFILFIILFYKLLLVII
jgi:hypothetical protein